jgi:hypothetical protein
MSTIENFTFKVPNSITNRPNLRPLFASALLACLLTYPILGINQSGIFASILLFIIFFILLTSLTNENLSNELPSTLYPTSPRMGLDGISLNSYVSGNDNNINSKFGNY